MNDEAFSGQLREKLLELKGRLEGDLHPSSELLVALIEHELDPETTSHVRLHTLFCPECRNGLYGLRAAIAKDRAAAKTLQPSRVTALLRVARGLVECFQISGGAEGETLAATAATRGESQTFSMPFQLLQTLADPKTGIQTALTLRVEESVKPGQVKFVIHVHPVPQQWRVLLLNAQSEEIASMPLAGPRLEVGSAVPCGFYVVEIRKNDSCLSRFDLTVEPFSLPEAIQRGLEYLGEAQYSRALAILESATERHPTSTEASDAFSMARVIAGQDTETLEREQETLGRVRGVSDFLQRTQAILEQAATRHGQSLALVLAVASLNPFAVSSQVVRTVREKSASSNLLHTIDILNQRLKNNETQLDELRQLVSDLKTRLDRFPTFMSDLRRSIDEIRRQVDKSVDEKSVAIDDLRRQFGESLDKAGLSLPEYRLYLAEHLGDACWTWLGSELQTGVGMSESLYWHLQGQSGEQDYSFASLLLCRSLDLLAMDKLVDVCTSVRTALMNAPELKQLVQARLTGIDLDRMLISNSAFFLRQAASVLQVGRQTWVTTNRNVFGNQAGALLTEDHVEVDLILPLTAVAGIFQRTLGLPEESASRLVASREEAQLLRKLILGADEGGVSVEIFLEWLSGLPESDSGLPKVINKISSAAWKNYPGIIAILWKVLDPSAKRTK